MAKIAEMVDEFFVPEGFRFSSFSATRDEQARIRSQEKLRRLERLHREKMAKLKNRKKRKR